MILACDKDVNISFHSNKGLSIQKSMRGRKNNL